MWNFLSASFSPSLVQLAMSRIFRNKPSSAQASKAHLVYFWYFFLPLYCCFQESFCHIYLHLSIYSMHACTIVIHFVYYCSVHYIALNLPYELNLYIRRRIANMWCINVAVALRLFVSGIQSSQFTSCCHFSRASIYLKNTSFVITLCAAALTQQGKWSSKTRRDSPFPLRILF